MKKEYQQPFSKIINRPPIAAAILAITAFPAAHRPPYPLTHREIARPSVLWADGLAKI